MFNTLELIIIIKKFCTATIVLIDYVCYWKLTQLDFKLKVIQFDSY